MKVYVRKTNYLKDLFFYIEVLLNPETKKMMFEGSGNLWRYFFPWRYYRRYVCIAKKNGKTVKIALAQFSKGKPGEFWIAGAVNKESINSGMGIYAGIAFIDQFFKEQPSAIIKSGSFSFNERAYRTTLSFGFQLDTKDDKHFESSLTKEMFDNEFVRKIKERANI